MHLYMLVKLIRMLHLIAIKFESVSIIHLELKKKRSDFYF
jgi:hypothetical protein